MIRRVVEYVIVCDAKSISGEECPEIGGTAFGSPTMADCATSATEYRWKKISKRLWLCPQCAAKLAARGKEQDG